MRDWIYRRVRRQVLRDLAQELLEEARLADRFGEKAIAETIRAVAALMERKARHG